MCSSRSTLTATPCAHVTRTGAEFEDVIRASDADCDDRCQMTVIGSLSMPCLTCMQSSVGMACFPASLASCTAEDVTIVLEVGERCGNDNPACVKPYMSEISADCTLCLGEHTDDVTACFPDEPDGQCGCADVQALTTAAACGGDDACATRAMSGASQTCVLCVAEQGAQADKHCVSRDVDASCGHI